MTIVNLSGREHEAQVHALLAQAQIHRDPADATARGPAIAAAYADTAGLSLWGWCDGGVVLGLIGLEYDGDNTGIVRNLAVDQGRRGQGIGRYLVEHARTVFFSLAGDTLAPAAGFYCACGFDVTSVGTLTDGRELLRFTASGALR